MRNIDKRTALFRGFHLLPALVAVLLFFSCGQNAPDDRPLTDAERNETAYGTDGEGENLADTETRPKLVLADGIVDSEKGTVTVTVSIENNPGISALQFHVQYGEELELQSIQFDARFGSYVTAPTPYKSPQTITFLSPLGGVSENGLFAVMVFRVADHVEPNTTAYIHAAIVSENTLSDALEEIAFEVVDSTVAIE